MFEKICERNAIRIYQQFKTNIEATAITRTLCVNLETCKEKNNIRLLCSNKQGLRQGVPFLC